LRPLRIERFRVAGAESVAILGFDEPAAEVFVNMITGAALPDSGTVRVFGRESALIADSSDWLAVVDRFGLLTDRAVLLHGMTVEQNLALPFTIEVDRIPDDVRARVEALAAEVDLAAALLGRPAGDVPTLDQVRLRLARAVALDPAILVLEHPTARLPRADVRPFAALVASVARRRKLATLALTGDREFADAVAARVLTHEGATGRLWERGWFGRLVGR
jgi:phospholipid/cholesterol/gamma-HCH transport system ATP-binding protein